MVRRMPSARAADRAARREDFEAKTEAMLTMRPCLCFCMIGSTAATPKEALDVHNRYPVPFFDLERRQRHDPEIVRDRVDPAVLSIVP